MLVLDELAVEVALDVSRLSADAKLVGILCFSVATQSDRRRQLFIWLRWQVACGLFSSALCGLLSLEYRDFKYAHFNLRMQYDDFRRSSSWGRR